MVGVPFFKHHRPQTHPHQRIETGDWLFARTDTSMISVPPAFRFCLLVLLLFLPSAQADNVPASARVLSDLDAYPQILGTQTIGAAYQFTGESKLVETAESIAAMGSNTLKCALRPNYFGPTGNVPAKNLAIKTL